MAVTVWAYGDGTVLLVSLQKQCTQLRPQMGNVLSRCGVTAILEKQLSKNSALNSDLSLALLGDCSLPSFLSTVMTLQTKLHKAPYSSI